jgi:hypothetical protein
VAARIAGLGHHVLINYAEHCDPVALTEERIQAAGGQA